MTLTIQAEAPPLTVLENGTVRIAGSRVNLEFVVEAYLSGMTAERIAEEFPTLQPADIHAVIGWFLRHRAEVETYMGEQERDGARIEEAIVRSQGHGAEFKKKLLARRTGTINE